MIIVFMSFGRMAWALVHNVPPVYASLSSRVQSSSSVCGKPRVFSDIL